MTRTGMQGKQLLLLPVGDMGPPNDPIGVALGIVGDGDPDETWREVMALFGRMAVRVYHQTHAGPGSVSEC